MKQITIKRHKRIYGFSTLETTILVILVFFVIIVILPKKPIVETQSNSVFFSNARISLAPGIAWDIRTSGSFAEIQQRSLCLPVLLGLPENGGGLIQVFTTSNSSDVYKAATIFLKDVDSNSQTIKDSINHGGFDSRSGVHGIQVSYLYQTKDTPPAKLQVQAYLFQNKENKCIIVHYISFADKDSARANQMILNTLELN